MNAHFPVLQTYVRTNAQAYGFLFLTPVPALEIYLDSIPAFLTKNFSILESQNRRSTNLALIRNVNRRIMRL